MANRWVTMETVTDFILGGSKITADGDSSHEIKRRVFLGRKAMTNLDSILKSRDITLLKKVHIVKATVFPVVTYGCELDHKEGWAFELWCWRRLLRVPWTTRRSNQSILKEISPEYSLEGLMLKLKLQYFGHLLSSSPQFFPAPGSFPVRWLFPSGGQSIGALASALVLPMNIQDWFPLGLAGLISLQSKGLSRIFSSSKAQKHQFFNTQPSSQSSSHIHIWPEVKP